MARLTDLIKGNPLLAAAFFIFFAVYSNSLNNSFQRDDIPHIVNNASLRETASFAKLFSRDYFQLNGSVAYRPAVAAVRMLEYRAFGLDQRLWRLFNLLLHAVNAALLFWIFLRLTGLPAAAAAGAALFLLHPAHTEALNYISNGQCDILCLFFLCVSFAAYLKNGKALALAAFCLALLSKEMALALPLLLGVYEYFYGDLKKNWKVPAYSAALALVFVVWRLAWFKAGPGFIDSVQAENALSFSLRGAAAAFFKFPLLLFYYFKLLLWPSALSVEIDRLLPEAGFFSGTGIALGWLFVLLSAAGAFYMKNKVYAFVLLSFVIALLPVSGLVPLTSLVQEHFVYIPSVFICLLAGLGYAKTSEFKGQRTALAAAGLVLLFSVGRIWARNSDWRTPLTLAEGDLRAFPASATAAIDLAFEKEAAGEYAAALDLAREAVERGLGGGEAYFLMADIHLRTGKRPEAVEAARQGLANDGLNPDAWVNAARIYARAGLLREALACSREAVRRFPAFEPAYNTLGEILLLKREPAEARAMFKEAVRLNSRSSAARRLDPLESPAPGR